MPIVLLPSASGELAFAILDVDGVEHMLDHDLTGYLVLPGPIGRFNAPRALVTQAVPLRDGVDVRRVNVGGQQMTVPLHVSGAATAEVWDRVAALGRWLDTDEDHAAYFRAQRPDGAWREIAVQYRSGLEGDESWGRAGPGWMAVALELLAPDPAWYDLTDQTATYTTGGAVGSWPASWPIILASSEVLAIAGVVNSGDLPAYPIWTVTGPGADIEITNLTTGDRIGVDTTLLSGQQVVIDTRPPYLRASSWQVYDPLGASLFSAASGSLWTLPPGTSSVQVAMANATAASSVQLSYRRRWLGP